MNKKRVLTILMTLVLLLSFSSITAAESTVTLEAISSKHQGDPIILKGITDKSELVVQIYRPNQTLMYTDVLMRDQLLAGKTVVLPTDALVGIYTVIAGSGSSISRVEFVVAAKEAGPTDPEQPPGTEDPKSSEPSDGAAPATEIEKTVKSDGSVEWFIKGSSPDVSGVVKAVITNATFIKNDPQLTNGKLTITVVGQKNAKAYDIHLPTTLFTNLNRKYPVELKTETAALLIPPGMVSGMVAGNEADVSIRISVMDQAALSNEVRDRVGDRPLIDLQLLVDGKKAAWSNPGAPVTVSIPYTLTAEERLNPEHVIIWYVDELGKITPVPSGKYNAKTGRVEFTTTHFSVYAVGYQIKTFADLKNHPWARKQIEVLASKGVITGTSEQTYTPAASITRGDFLQLLVKTLNLHAEFTHNFSDSKPSDYYYQALGIAKKLGISEGIGNNRYNPKAAISRQDMMVLTAKALEIKDQAQPREDSSAFKVEGSRDDLHSFTDKTDVAAYAVESIAALYRSGMVKGNGSQLTPVGHTTRAETAVLMYRLYNR